MVEVLYYLTFPWTLFAIFALVFSLSVTLFYLSELVEEYTLATLKLLKYLIGCEFALQAILLTLQPGYSLVQCLIATLNNACYTTLLHRFPAFQFSSRGFISSCVTCVLHHIAVLHFMTGDSNGDSHSSHGTYAVSFPEMLTYLSFAVWPVPFVLLLSLSANDFVLPTSMPSSAASSSSSSSVLPQHHPFSDISNRSSTSSSSSFAASSMSSSSDFISSYLKGQRKGLNHVLTLAKNSLLPALGERKKIF